MESFLQFFQDYPVLNIFILLIVVAIVLSRLPKVDLGYSRAFKKRRVINWMTIGLAYAFLYMGRYNLTVSKNAFGELMTKQDFGIIFLVGTWVYGVSFIINGPLTDKWGGRRTIIISTLGSALANLLMGLVTYFGFTSNLVVVFSVLYGLNMYFQSFGAVSIVKVNSEWFNIKERGTFGGIFGILISLGLYFAYDWGGLIAKNFAIQWVFFVPMLMLGLFCFLCFILVHDTPEMAGHEPIITGTEGVADYGGKLSAIQVGVKMFQDPVIRVIAFVEF
jgi:OPA family glycerol-3-phosphate transporter-like MFS transporter